MVSTEMMLFLPFALGPTEMILILAVILIVFGVGRLPEVGGALGKGIREFRRASDDTGEKKPAVDAKAEATTKE